MRRVGLLLVVTLAAPAWAQSKKYPPEPVDKDQEIAERSRLWDNATNPRSEPYQDLVTDAKQAMSGRTDDRRRDAVDMLDQAIALLPDEPEAYALRGVAHMELQQWEKCSADLQAAVLKASPDELPDRKALVEQRKNLGLCQARAGKLGDAERTLSEAAATGTGTGEMLMRLGEVRIAMGKLDEAIAALTAALEASDAPSHGLIRWLLAVAYDRARRPGEAREAAQFAAKADGGGFRALRDTRVPLLGVGEIEYLLGLAWESNDPPRPEYALVYFRKFLRLAPDSPWRKRADDHLRELKTTVLPESIERKPGGTAAVDLDAARAIVRKQMPAMRACLAKVPNQAIEVKITRSGPRSVAPKLVRPDPFTRNRYRAPLPPAPPPDGTSVVASSELPFDAARADIDAAARCVDPIASKLVMPAVKEKDAWYQVAFLVVAP